MGGKSGKNKIERERGGIDGNGIAEGTAHSVYDTLCLVISGPIDLKNFPEY